MTLQIAKNAGEVSRWPISFCAAVIFLALIGSVASDDIALTLACGVVAALIAGLLWRVGEPPAIFMAVGVQLAQIVTPVIRATFLGVPLQDVSLGIGDVTNATWFALAAILCLAVGLWRGQIGTRFGAGAQLQAEVRTWSPEAAFAFCIAMLLLAAVFDVLGAIAEGLRQPCIALGHIRWLGVFVLSCVCFARQRGYQYLLLVTLFEAIEGFTGFFSDFKTVFLVLLVAIFSVRARLTLGKILSGVALGTFLILLGAWWSAVKEDYRLYVSEGSQEQTIAVSVEDRLDFLMDRALETNWETLSRGLDALAARLGYVDYLSAAMRYIPADKPFQNGAQMEATVLHVLEPRLLFPDKPPLRSDVAVLAEYTGIYFSRSSSVGTSISIGYLGELYVDFGIIGALVVICILGFCAGRCVRSIVNSTKLPVTMNYGLVLMLAMQMMWFEESLVKTVGGFVTTLLAIFVFRKYLLGYLLGRLLSYFLRTFGAYRVATSR